VVYGGKACLGFTQREICHTAACVAVIANTNLQIYK
jgi:hypothetical protein